MAKISNIKKPGKFLISQSNDLIEANYSSELTGQAHKIARLVLSLINPNDKDLRTYTVRLDTLKQYLGMPPNVRWGSFYERLKESAQKLNEKPIQIQKPNGNILVAYYLSAYEIDPKKGTITFEISSMLKPYLLELKKNYTSYLINYIPKLRSSYSIRLYELLHQYRKIGKRYFALSELQRKVGSNYAQYGDFKRNVIKQAQQDLKKHTDLSFIFNEIKTGRKVTNLEFIMFSNTPEENSQMELALLSDYIQEKKEEEEPALSEKIIKTLFKVGISEQNIAKYISQGFGIIADEEKRVEALQRCKTLGNYYLEKIKLFESSTSAQAAGNAAGFLVKALKEDWNSSKSLQKAASHDKAKQQKVARQKIKVLEQTLEDLSTQKDTVNKPIYAKLIADKSIFETAYYNAVETLGAFFKRNHHDLFAKPIQEQYETSRFLEVTVNMALRKMFPEKFTTAEKLEQLQNDTKKEIEAIRKQFRI